MQTFTFHSDPQHGWLKVPKDLLATLGIDQKITRYSYMRGAYAYLVAHGIPWVIRCYLMHHLLKLTRA